MVIAPIDHEEVAPAPDEPVTEMLHTLIHDVNNITHAINGYAALVNMTLADDTPDQDLIARAVYVILNRTRELTQLMQETAEYNRRLENDF